MGGDACKASWDCCVAYVRHLRALLLLSPKINFCLFLAGDVAKLVECLPTLSVKPWAPSPTPKKTGHGIEHL